jgi:two-component system, NtrC family, response regulator AtoC
MGSDVLNSLGMLGPAGELPPEEIIFGHTAAMKQIHEKLLKIIDAEVPVLVRGESGTGKEVIVNLMHARSKWRSGPLVKVHCPAIPKTLLESELFGYEEGAFTGALGPKAGRVEAAHGGTLLLDEIAELDAASQAKLLQVLQDGQVFRIGAQKGKRVQVRTVCATHRPVEQDIQSGRFRPDLFYRISVVTMHLPPLRERREDIPALAEYFLQLYSRKYARPVQPLSPYFLRLLEERDWPGNIRELENLMNRYVILGSEEIVSDELAGAQSGQPDSGHREGSFVSLRQVARRAARAAERRVILQALNANQGNRKKTARLLNISYRSLLYKIKDAGIPRKGSYGNSHTGSSANPTFNDRGLSHEPPTQ